MKIFLSLALAAFSLQAAETAPFPVLPSLPPAVLPEGYTVQTIAPPKGVAFSVTGLDCGADGSVWVCTREGAVWRLKSGTWSLFADGLQEPCGLLLDRKDGQETGAVFVAQKPELTELRDSDGDGLADEHRCVYQTVTSGNYHEFHYGPVRDAVGNFYGTLNLAHTNAGAAFQPQFTVHGVFMGSFPGSFRGTAYKAAADGKNFEPVAWGLRSPCGVGMMADGKLLYTENQGDYMPDSFLAVVEKGQFYGHPSGLLNHPDYQGKKLESFSDQEWAAKRVPPAVWIIHDELANSPGEPREDLTGGKFGPFAGQIFIGDQTKSNLIRCTLQQVKGQWQGCCIDFINHFRSGVVRNAFAADGALWVGETGRGWGSVGDLPFGLERVTWDGKTVPFCIKDIKLEKGGFRISFTKPVDPASLDVSKIGVRRWTYNFTHAYGSPHVEQKTVPAEGLQIAADGHSLFFSAELVKRRVYHLSLPALRSVEGKPLSVNHGYYTLNETLD